MGVKRTGMNNLGDFIATELRQRNMSARQFAEYVGVTHPTITKAMYSEPPEPSLEFLTKLALATHIDLCTIVALVKPDATNIRPGTHLIAERIARLPTADRDLIDGFLISRALKPGE